jgi:hypothetical protein
MLPVPVISRASHLLYLKVQAAVTKLTTMATVTMMIMMTMVMTRLMPLYLSTSTMALLVLPTMPLQPIVAK